MGSQLDPTERLEAASTHHASSHSPKQPFGSALSYICLYKIHLYYTYFPNENSNLLYGTLSSPRAILQVTF